mmetsp:Transcript_33169/g.77593  ORF Transcript_33169/g.77593 Transcript_33169/m.77593 type:complete len:99 (+) Transcript_33169:537-833(+)
MLCLAAAFLAGFLLAFLTPTEKPDGWLHGYRKVVGAYWTLHVRHAKEASRLTRVMSSMGLPLRFTSAAHQQEAMATISSLLGSAVSMLASPVASDWIV